MCWANARTHVLDKVMTWARGETSGESSGSNSGPIGRRGKRVFWLKGMASTGQATVARPSQQLR